VLVSENVEGGFENVEGGLEDTDGLWQHSVAKKQQT